MNSIGVARIGTVEAGKGHRILVDRLWPRGIHKTDVLWETWLKDLAPSTRLRQGYGHNPERYAAFREQYWKELTELIGSPGWETLLTLWQTNPIVLVTASRDVDHSQAPILRDFLQTMGDRSRVD
ncbi:MAG: DUF488 family protein [Sulfobacillus thermotolerans]|uniref:MarR family transcriptional regulator n=1 Tax=Sulfobacillus thermotolerans TaxID=338644 RepID=A0ABN5H1Y3_9FIRM|nr:hypothetical protein BXT84_12710 [Sulfobacillus thermotolerans]MCY0908984.1 DUF488 family protein [Sulfobacillus thermotolerans]